MSILSPYLSASDSGAGWLALIGGGEITFGETLDADAVWEEKAPEGSIGFLPTASGSQDYGDLFKEYAERAFGREASLIPVYRARDARRARNAERIGECAVVYLGGGIADQLAATLAGTAVAEAISAKLREGGVVVAIAAAANALGARFRSLDGREDLPGLGWLVGGVVETNFSPAHDRRLRRLLEGEGVEWGLGIPAGAAVLLGPDGETEIAGTVFLLRDAAADLEPLSSEPSD